MDEMKIEKKKRGRPELVGRLVARYEGRAFDDDGELFEQLNSDYDDMERLREENGRYKENDAKMLAMFDADPRSADIIAEWANGGDPVVSLVRMYGADIKDALEDEERLEAIAEANKEYLERVTKSREYEEAYAENLDKSFSMEDAAVSSGEISKSDAERAHAELGRIVGDYVRGVWSVDTLKAVCKSIDHDADVESASREGEVRGRNIRITEMKKKRSSGDGAPDISGGGMKKPSEEKDYGAIGRGYGVSDIWERGNMRRTKY